MDDIDLKIVTILQSDAKTSNAEIARLLEMAPSAILGRIRKLERDGIITAYEARINPQSVDCGLLAFVSVGVAEFGEMKSGDLLAAIPEVMEVHHVAGEDCWLIKVRAKDPASLGRLLNTQIGMIPNVTSTKTTIVMDSVKESGHVPLPPYQAENSNG